MPSSYLEFFTLIPLRRTLAYLLDSGRGRAVRSALRHGAGIQATRSNVMQAARGEFTTDFRPARLRTVLVVGQVTVSVLFLISAAVLIRVNHSMQQLDVGLRTPGVLELSLQDRFREKALQQVISDPAVQMVAAASKYPFGGSLPRVPVAAGPASEQLPAGYLYASPEYFQVFRLPILRGRNFTPEEATRGAAVAIVSQATARRLWPGHDRLGQSLTIQPNPAQPQSLADPRQGPPPYSSVLVIGIAHDAVNGWVGDGPDQTCIYFPTSSAKEGNLHFARVKGDVEAAARRLDAMLTSSIPGAVDEIHTMDEVLAAQLYPFQALYWTSSALGALALLLTLSGIYGVLSYVVTQRTKEIGIRLALGARPGVVAALVLRQSLRIAFVGAAIGGLAAVGLLRIASSQLDMKMFGPFDWVAFGTGLLLAIAASAAAAWLPSRRAAAIEPVSTLRCD